MQIADTVNGLSRTISMSSGSIMMTFNSLQRFLYDMGKHRELSASL